MVAKSKPDPEMVRSILPPLANVSPPKVGTIWETVLLEMLQLFYPPMRADTDQQMLEQVALALRAYMIDLAEFDGEQLRDGWAAVRRTHKVARWPAIQAIRDACAAARDRRSSRGAGVGLTLEALFRTGVDSRWIARCHGLKGRAWLTEFWGPPPGDPDCRCPVIVLEFFGPMPKPEESNGAPAENARHSAAGPQTAERPPEAQGLLAGV